MLRLSPSLKIINFLVGLVLQESKICLIFCKQVFNNSEPAKTDSLYRHLVILLLTEMGSEPSKHQKSRRKSSPHLPPMGRYGPSRQRTTSLPDISNPPTVNYAIKGSGENTPGRQPFRRQNSGGSQPIKDTTSKKPVPPTPKKNENTYVEHKGI